MFKPSSGRKQESCVWTYFAYDAATDRSCCRVRDGELAKGGEKQECGKWLIGKIALI
jgi:hypothetical protein